MSNQSNAIDIESKGFSMTDADVAHMLNEANMEPMYDRSEYKDHSILTVVEKNVVAGLIAKCDETEIRNTKSFVRYFKELLETVGFTTVQVDTIVECSEELGDCRTGEPEVFMDEK